MASPIKKVKGNEVNEVKKLLQSLEIQRDPKVTETLFYILNKNRGWHS